MTRPDASGKIRITQQKTGTPLVISVHPNLERSIEACGLSHMTILVTTHAKPFSIKGFGQFMSEAIRAADLPSRCKAHGLRKAMARRLAEKGNSSHEIMSVTGHKTWAEVERYTSAVAQERLNEKAIRGNRS